MEPGLVIGMTRTRRFDMNEDRAIGFIGEGLRGYATPFLLQDIERTG